MSYEIPTAELNRGEFPKFSTARAQAKRSARHHGAALHVDPGTTRVTLYYVKDGRMRQAQRGNAAFTVTLGG